jgi:hypothetical protein
MNRPATKIEREVKLFCNKPKQAKSMKTSEFFFISLKFTLYSTMEQ